MSKVTKLPEYKYLMSCIHKKFPKHKLMLEYVYRDCVNFLVAKPTTHEVMSNDEFLKCRTAYELSSKVMPLDQVAEFDEVAYAWLNGFSRCSFNYEIIDPLKVYCMKDNTKLFSGMLKFLMTQQFHYDTVYFREHRGKSPYDYNCDNIAWKCVKDKPDGTWFDEFKVTNDLIVEQDRE